MGEPTVEEFIRHLQVELEQCDSIVDYVERQQRQIQIENGIQEALSFQQRHAILENAGIDPLKITEAVRLIKSNKETPKPSQSNSETQWCPKCESSLEDDLNFCPACGHKV